jgi:hypothetical protein
LLETRENIKIESHSFYHIICDWFSQGSSKKIIFLLKKKIQNGRFNKTEFFKIANSQNVFVKISWIGPWISMIDWCKGHWCSSTYMVKRLSDVSSKTSKKCIFCVYRLFLPLRHQSILLTQGSIHEIFTKCFWELAILKNSVFLVGHFGFFFSKKYCFLFHPHENQSKLLGYQGWVQILMITLVYGKRVSVRSNLLHSVYE